MDSWLKVRPGDCCSSLNPCFTFCLNFAPNFQLSFKLPAVVDASLFLRALRAAVGLQNPKWLSGDKGEFQATFPPSSREESMEKVDPGPGLWLGPQNTAGSWGLQALPIPATGKKNRFRRGCQSWGFPTVHKYRLSERCLCRYWRKGF